MTNIHRIGIVHPGEMGISIAASAQKNGHQVYWASEGRSPQTRARAARFALNDAHTVSELCTVCSMIISICPPDAAESVAAQVSGHGFTGLYLDANAISPQRAIHLHQMMQTKGISFVDGGIIGGPAWTPGTTYLYLSGSRAGEVADCFSAGPVETRVIGDEAGKASALKMCFAAYSKGTTALLCTVLAAAEQLGVREELHQQWSQNDPESRGKISKSVGQAALKAWRFAGEMEEIAATFRDVGQPGEFHETAERVYRRLAPFKSAHGTPTIEEVVTVLCKTTAPNNE